MVAHQYGSVVLEAVRLIGIPPKGHCPQLRQEASGLLPPPAIPTALAVSPFQQRLSAIPAVDSIDISYLTSESIPIQSN
jgi:hypothetical protein